MAISLKTTKILWGRSGNQCAICQTLLIEEAIGDSDDDSVVGDMAHIIARKENFTRGDYDSLTEEERDHYTNLVLLCRKHHKIIDDQPNYYSVERLREIKQSHEERVRSKLQDADQNQQRDDLIFASIIDEWCKRMDIDNWTAKGTFIYSASGPEVSKEYHKSLTELSSWIISRVWPHRYEDLENAFFNFKAVLTDFLAVLGRYLIQPTPESEWLITNKFYKIREWNPQKYEELYKNYDEHICLVWNLFTELTRSANLVCSKIREHIFPGFRLKEGVLLVERNMVMIIGSGITTQYYRAEYSVELQKQKNPYKSLKEFEKTQYDGDYVLMPEHLRKTAE